MKMSGMRGTNRLVAAIRRSAEVASGEMSASSEPASKVIIFANPFVQEERSAIRDGRLLSRLLASK
jgi:hypothetical protein